MALISIPEVLAVSALHSGSDDCLFIYMQPEFYLKNETAPRSQFHSVRVYVNICQGSQCQMLSDGPVQQEPISPLE